MKRRSLFSLLLLPFAKLFAGVKPKPRSLWDEYVNNPPDLFEGSSEIEFEQDFAQHSAHLNWRKLERWSAYTEEWSPVQVEDWVRKDRYGKPYMKGPILQKGNIFRFPDEPMKNWIATSDAFGPDQAFQVYCELTTDPELTKISNQYL